MRTAQGVVVSAKMQKTIVARIERQVQHPRYKKYLVQRTKVKARDEVGCREGDVVILAETRRFSRSSSWRVVRVVGRRAVRDREDAQAAVAAPKSGSEGSSS